MTCVSTKWQKSYLTALTSKIVTFVVFFLSLFVFLGFSFAKTDIVLFGLEQCPHCQDAKNFLEEQKVQNTIPDFTYIEIQKDQEWRDMFNSLVTRYKLTKTVPVMYIAWDIVQWYTSDDVSWQKILQLLQKRETNKAVISLEDALVSNAWVSVSLSTQWLCDDTQDDAYACEDTEQTKDSYMITVPLFWSVDLATLWLWVWSVLLWFVDWFNPCAMWVLVLFLTALIQVGDRKKMLQIVWIFLLAEAIMYYMIMNVWMYSWDFIGYDAIVTPIIWWVAIAAWLYFLYERKTWDGTCKVGSLEQKRKTSLRIKELAKKPMTRAVFFGVLWLALSVNVIEFACSIWIPQTYTKRLDIYDLSYLVKQAYLSVYILFYMIDDLIVFWIAIYSFEKIWMTTKYSKMSHLVWWILMLILGMLMLFAPGLLF